eukprot:1507755-Lingulodinium_polyedra.AAC.1
MLARGQCRRAHKKLLSLLDTGDQQLGACNWNLEKPTITKNWPFWLLAWQSGETTQSKTKQNNSSVLVCNARQ